MPSSARVVIIGGTAAGSKAAATARRRDPNLRIDVYQSGADVSYSACGTPYHLADAVRVPRTGLIARTPAQFKRSGINVEVGQRVEAVDVKAGELHVTDLASGKSRREGFDKLLIATGAEPIEPPIPVAKDAPPVATLRSLSDIDRIGELANGAQRVVIVGGGYVGLEMAEAFHALGKTVVIAEQAPRLLPNFEEVFAHTVQAHLEAHGIECHLGSGIAEITPAGVRLASGADIAGDLVLMAVGLRPSTALARDIGLELGASGAIVTDDAMRTGFDNVYAAGDCALSRHRISNSLVWVALGDIANRQGRVAGENIAGGDAHFPGILGTAIFKVFDLGVANTGLSLAQAEACGFDAVSVRVTAPTRARYMPASNRIDLTLVAECNSARLLGAQAVGADAVDKTIDIVAAGLWGGLTAHDLAEVDLAYAPPFSPVISPVQVAAELLRKKVG